MALQKQRIPLSIVDGIDTKTDEKNVLATKFLSAQNVVYTKTGAANKDSGFNALSTNIDGGGAIGSGRAITTYFDEILEYSNNKLYSFSQTKTQWYDKGFVSNCVANQKSIATIPTPTGQFEYATLSNIGCYGYSTISGSTTTYYIRLIDETTGTILFTHTLNGTNFTHLHIHTVGTYFVIVYRDNLSNVVYRTISISALSTLSAATTIGTAPNGFIDAAMISTRLFIGWWDNTAGNFKIGYLDSALTFTQPLTLTGTGTLLSISKEGTSNNIRIVYSINTTLYDFNLLTQLHTPQNFTSGPAPSKATAVEDPNNNSASIILSCAASDVAQIGVKKCQVTSGGVIAQLGTVLYATNLVTKAQVINGQVYAVLGKRLNDDNSLGTKTYFLVSKDGQIVGKVADEAGFSRAGDLNIRSLRVNGNELSFLHAETSTDTLYRINKYIFDFSSSNNYYDALLGDQLHIAGGVLSSYDGNKITEQGFLEIPITPTATIISINPSVGVGSGVSTAYPQTVLYYIVFAWIDNQGQIHRSAPSLPVSVTVPNNTSKIQLTIRPLTITNKDNVEIEVYRTAGNGTVPYKVSSISDVTSITNSRVLNDPTLATITFQDVATDDVITNKEILYTQSGELENIAPISCKHIAANKNRLFILSGDGYSFQYSKLREAKTGVSFNDTAVIDLDRASEEGQALALMDENLIILKRKGLLYFPGEGPTNLGEQNDFKQPITIPSDVGLKDVASVVTTPMGILFKSDKGIYILRRNLTVEYIGMPVEGFNSLTITSAVLIDNLNQVRFTTADGTCLIYHYFDNRWSTRINITALDSLIFESSFTYLNTNGQLLQQSSGVWSDNGTYIPILLESSWIQFGNIQGFQRFYRMLILGTYKNNHKLKVSFAYDFNTSYSHSVTIDTGALFSNSGDLYQVEVFPKIQKCQAFKFKIETVYNGVYGEDVSISNFTLVVGSKGTERKGVSKYAAT